jgi:hypothetical protein
MTVTCLLSPQSQSQCDDAVSDTFETWHAMPVHGAGMDEWKCRDAMLRVSVSRLSFASRLRVPA